MKSKVFDVLQLVAEDVIPVGHARIAAAVVYKGQIISIGTCRYHSHPFQKKYGPNNKAIYLHAEIDAILRAKRRSVDLSKCDLYISRVKRPSSWSNTFVSGLAKPCSGCSRAIKDEGIRNVYYSLDSD